MQKYRPSSDCLELFYVLAEGNDEKRESAAVQLVSTIGAIKQKSERQQLTTYCVNRLVKGLGSGRQFARVGFASALTLVLRERSEVKTKEIIECFNKNLKSTPKSLSKSEKSAFYLGYIFALSTLVQSGRITKVDGDTLVSVVQDLLVISQKRSFLRPLSGKALELLINDVSKESFSEHVWPIIEQQLSQGWTDCTLDRIVLLVTCSQRFPELVDTEFIEKHFGDNLFSGESDGKLLQVIQISTEKLSAVREKIIPAFLASGRDIGSIWKGIGAKLFSSGKDNMTSQHQILSLELLSELILRCTDSEQMWSLMLYEGVADAIFMENRSKNEILEKILTNVINSICEKLKLFEVEVWSFITTVLDLEGKVAADAGILRYISSNGFAKILTLLNKEEMEKFIALLVEFLKGRDNNKFFSECGKKRNKQLDWCIKQLQHLCCSQEFTTPEIQSSILAFFLRNGFFKANNKNDTIIHCDYIDEFVETEDIKKMSRIFLSKTLNQLSSMTFIQKSKVKSFSSFTDRLSYLAHYFQSLLACKEVDLVADWSQETLELWSKLIKRIKAIEKAEKKGKGSNADSAFRLLYLYLAFQLMSDVKTATKILQDIFICQDKSKAEEEESQAPEDGEDPHWVEVLVEILLELLSFNSHEARVIATKALASIVPYMTPQALGLITQVLIPSTDQQNEMFEDEDEDDEEEEIEEDMTGENGENGVEDDDGNSGDDEEEENDDEEDDDDESEEEGDEEEENMEVDDTMRASLKEALGDAAVEEDDEEEDLPDMSDSEMFKLDEALAEVFRQKKKVKGRKKAAKEKKKELAIFRLRALDMVEVLVKCDRCGDFVVDLFKPLLQLIFDTKKSEAKAAADRAKSLFDYLRKDCGAITNSILSKKEQKSLFQELIELGHKGKTPLQSKCVAVACSVMVKLFGANCLSILQEMLTDVLTKQKSKLPNSFVLALSETDPVLFQPLLSMLIDYLKNSTVQQNSKILACTLLSSVADREHNSGKDSTTGSNVDWMKQAASAVGAVLQLFHRGDTRGVFFRDILKLGRILATRCPDITAEDFGPGLREKMLEMRPKMSKNTRDLSKKLLAALSRKEKSEPQVSTSTEKRKVEESESTSSPGKKKKKKNKTV